MLVRILEQPEGVRKESTETEELSMNVGNGSTQEGKAICHLPQRIHIGTEEER